MASAETPGLPGDATLAGRDTTSGRAVGSGAPVSPPARTWTIALPAGMELLTSNNLGKGFGKRYRISEQIKGDAIKLCRAAKVPHLDGVSIVAVWHPPTAGRSPVRDCHNLSPSLKAAVDGIKKAGVLTDDSDRYVANTDIRPGENRPYGQLVIHITEVTTQNGEPLT